MTENELIEAIERAMRHALERGERAHIVYNDTGRSVLLTVIHEAMDEARSRANTEHSQKSQQLQSELRVADAECELRRIDSARLDFLGRAGTTIQHTDSGFIFLRLGISTYAGGATLREAIDCAMHAEEIDR